MMELKCLISSHKPPPSVCAVPFFLPCYSSPLLKPKSFCSPITSDKTHFLGQNLVLRGINHAKVKKYFPVVRAGPVKRRKELPFDNVIQRDKKLKLVLKIRRILMSQPDRIMALRQLGRFRRALGLQKKRRFIALLKKFPAVFEIVEEGAYSLRFKLTPEAEKLYLEEMKIRNEMEDLLVIKLRKLLMMSIDKRILLGKIAHLKTDLGLPMEFQDTICQRYPQYFKVVPTGRGPALELTHWDPDLAVSAAELAEEENREREMEERDLIIDRVPKFNRVKLPKGLSLSKGEMRRISQFRDMPYISPYSDFSSLRSGSPEKEKHACGVIHEMLSLTLEKRTLVDHLTHFREEFRFSQQLRGMLIRHPDMFYVSLKGDRDSVFLREAYRDSVLIEKDKMLLIKEKLRALVNVPKFPRRNAPRTDSGEDEGTEQEGASDDEDEWSDVENVASDEDDEGEDYDDEWSDDDDDDVPPDFNDGENEPLPSFELSKPTEQVNGASKKSNEKVLAPVFPDGRPRERWKGSPRVKVSGMQTRYSTFCYWTENRFTNRGSVCMLIFLYILTISVAFNWQKYETRHLCSFSRIFELLDQRIFRASGLLHDPNEAWLGGIEGEITILAFAPVGLACFFHHGSFLSSLSLKGFWCSVIRLRPDP